MKFEGNEVDHIPSSVKKSMNSHSKLFCELNYKIWKGKMMRKTPLFFKDGQRSWPENGPLQPHPKLIGLDLLMRLFLRTPT